MRILIAAILALASALPASAQNQLQFGSGALVKSMSPSELLSLLQTNGLNASYLEENGGNHYIEVNQNGAVMYFAMRECSQGGGLASRCGTIQPFGYFNATGVTFAQINAFNIERSRIGFAGLNPSGRGIIGAKIYLQAGVSNDHVPFSIGLFYLDLDTLIAAINPGTMASIVYNSAEAPESKISNNALGLAAGDLRLANGAQWRVNRVGANAPSFLNDAFRAYLDQE